MLSALGVDVRRVFTVVFALGTGIAGAAGVLLAWDRSVASVPLAAETLLPAFVVVIVGGFRNVPRNGVAALWSVLSTQL
ncbi:MAG: hypothetical protein U5K28_05110 [Halobacteriales archaeon]|nr:hypothetical protein [Halobacteriales archaeon]